MRTHDRLGVVTDDARAIRAALEDLRELIQVRERALEEMKVVYRFGTKALEALERRNVVNN